MQERNRRIETEQLVRWAAWGLLLALGGALAVLSITHLTKVLLPAAAGYTLAACIRALGRWVGQYTGDRRLHLGPVGERIGGMGLATALCVLLGWGGYRGVCVLAGQASALAEQAAEFLQWESLPSWLTDRIPPALQSQIGETAVALLEKGAGWLAGWAGSFAAALPRAVLTVFVTIASVFYWLIDRQGILTSLRDLLPPRLLGHPWLTGLRDNLSAGLQTAGRYLRAQLIIGSVIFTVLLTGLTVLKTPAPAAWAFLIAMVDLLPLLGAGAVLLPWSLWVWLTEGSGLLAWGLPLLWLGIWLLRQWLEPRVLGKMLGIHPYLLLWGMYAGFRLAGFAGMFVVVLILVALGKRETASP